MTDAILSAVVVGKNSLAREGLRRILAEENFSVQASVESGTSFLLANAESVHSGQ
jgi:two-component system, NarL family, nitrate/nitrite response regulator NarL